MVGAGPRAAALGARLLCFLTLCREGAAGSAPCPALRRGRGEGAVV